MTKYVSNAQQILWQKICIYSSSTRHASYSIFQNHGSGLANASRRLALFFSRLAFSWTKINLPSVSNTIVIGFVMEKWYIYICILCARFLWYWLKTWRIKHYEYNTTGQGTTRQDKNRGYPCKKVCPAFHNYYTWVSYDIHSWSTMIWTNDSLLHTIAIVDTQPSQQWD